MLAKLRLWARRLKTETFALYLAARDPRTPWYARVWAGLVVAYALSPIDLIPDVIPVLGYLDDVLLVPLGIALALRLVPVHVLADCRIRSAELLATGRPTGRVGLIIVVAIWLGVLGVIAWAVLG